MYTFGKIYPALAMAGVVLRTDLGQKEAL